MLFFLIFFMVFSLDRLSKAMALGHLAPAESIPVIPNLFYLTRVQNTGAAFGLLKDSQIALSVVSVLFLAFLFCFVIPSWRRQQNANSPVGLGRRRLCEVSWAMMGAGALGNLVDRLTVGAVIDFLDFRIWPVFNIADTFICIGAAFMMIDYFMSRQKKG
jgi:signal peptidase II